MNFQLVALSVLVACVLFVAIWKAFLEPTAGWDKPINLSDPEHADDFGRYVQTLPADQQAVIGAYLDRVDQGELLAGEVSWYEAEVTPRKVIRENNSGSE